MAYPRVVGTLDDSPVALQGRVSKRQMDKDVCRNKAYKALRQGHGRLGGG